MPSSSLFSVCDMVAIGDMEEAPKSSCSLDLWWSPSSSGIVYLSSWVGALTHCHGCRLAIESLWPELQIHRSSSTRFAAEFELLKTVVFDRVTWMFRTDWDWTWFWRCYRRGEGSVWTFYWCLIEDFWRESALKTNTQQPQGVKILEQAFGILRTLVVGVFQSLWQCFRSIWWCFQSIWQGFRSIW